MEEHMKISLLEGHKEFSNEDEESLPIFQMAGMLNPEESLPNFQVTGTTNHENQEETFVCVECSNHF